ncbi:hypothetical protein OPQ81_000534 [Rhizoctonia solani]|nr:hypothetical protein OPQ81_000534 [Rhizoctonia solani]
MDENLAEQVALLLESTITLQRTLAHVVAQLPPNTKYLPNLSDLNLNTPASAQASVLAPGVPIPSRGWQKDHPPKQRVLAEAKARLMNDGWADCDDTDMHAARLTDAMLRMGMEDMDNFMTEPGDCYSLRMCLDPISFPPSLTLSSAGFLQMLVVPSVAVGLFAVYYVSASVRSPLYALLFDIKQFDDNDFRGLRVQLWTPFTLGTHHLVNYLFIFVINPIRKLVRKWHTPSPKVLEPVPLRPELRNDLADSEKTSDITP